MPQVRGCAVAHRSILEHAPRFHLASGSSNLHPHLPGKSTSRWVNLDGRLASLLHCGGIQGSPLGFGTIVQPPPALDVASGKSPHL